MALTPAEVLDAVSEWNLVQVKEFVDNFCEKFDVDASAPAGGAMMMAAPGAAVAEPEAEKTEFTVNLKSYKDDSKIKVIKAIRAITSLGLKEAKEMVEGAPIDVIKDISKDEAEKIQKQLEEAGGEAVLT